MPPIFRGKLFRENHTPHISSTYSGSPNVTGSQTFRMNDACDSSGAWATFPCPLFHKSQWQRPKTKFRTAPSHKQNRRRDIHCLTSYLRPSNLGSRQKKPSSSVRLFYAVAYKLPIWQDLQRTLPAFLLSEMLSEGLVRQSIRTSVRSSQSNNASLFA